MDIARLQLEVDSSSVPKATATLDALSAAAMRVDQRMESIGAASARSFSALGSFGSAAQQAATHLDTVRRSAGLTANEMLNVSYQLNDIAVSLASGSSPFVVLTQQGLQLTQIFEASGNRSLGAAVRALGSSFLSMINPLNAAVVGLGIATTVAASYLGEFFGNEGKEAEEALKRHKDLIGDIKDAWPEAAGAIEQYGQRSRAVLQALNEISREGLRSVLASQTAELDSALQDLLLPLRRDGESIGPLNDAIRDLYASMAEGRPEVENFARAVAEVANDPSQPESVRALAREMLQLSGDATSTAAALSESEAAAAAMARTARYAAGDVEVLGKALRSLQGLGLPRLSDAQKAEEAYNEARRNASDAKDATAALNEYNAALERIDRREKEAEAAKFLPKSRPAGGADTIDLFDPDPRTQRKRSGGGSRKTEAEKDAEAYDNLIERAQRYVDQLAIEQAALGMTKTEATAYRMEQQLLLDARQRDIDLSPKQREEIHAVAQAYAEAKAEMEAIKQAQEAVKESATFVFGEIESALTSLIQGGESASKVMLKLAVNIGMALAKGALLNEGPFAGLFSGLLGGIFGGGTFTPGADFIPLYHEGGWVGRGGRGKMVDASVFAGAARMHSGGLAGDEVPAILQRGEYVLSKKDVAGIMSGQGRIAPGGGTTRVVIDVNPNKNFDASVRQISRDESTTVAASAIGQYDQGMPARIKDMRQRSQLR